MNNAVKSYFQNNNNFQETISLSENSDSFKDIAKKTKCLPKAWFELAKLQQEDRIEFSRDYILKALPYIPHVYSFIYDFFYQLEDLSVILSKKNGEDLYTSQIVYSVNNDDVFYRGFPPADNAMIDHVNSTFRNLLPSDFLTFLKIHNGFCKNEDTGVFKVEILQDAFEEFQRLVSQKSKSIKVANRFIDPNVLVPFYQCYSRDNFQCFNLEWFPKGSAGNVYYSGSDNSISDYQSAKSSLETMAFPTFLDWLIFYLDVMDLS